MSETELYEKYHDKLPVFFVEDIYKEKYVDLERENNTENNSEGEWYYEEVNFI